MNRLLLFIVGALLFGGVSLGLGYLVWDDDALIQGGAAFALAFIPAVATLAWVIWSYRAVPDMRLLASLGGSGVRMMIAVGGGFILTNVFGETFKIEFFFCWLLLFYLVLLFFEMVLLVQQEENLNGPAPTNLPSQGGGNG